MQEKVNMLRVNDPNYRYKMTMPEIQTHTDGKHKQTEIRNLYAIAQDVNRPLEHIAKFLSVKLSTQVDLKVGTQLYKLTPAVLTKGLGEHSQRPTVVLKGIRSLGDLLDTLYMFNERYVRCKYCANNPETTIQATDEDGITLQCSSCGKSFRLNAVVSGQRDELVYALCRSRNTAVKNISREVPNVMKRVGLPIQALLVNPTEATALDVAKEMNRLVHEQKLKLSEIPTLVVAACFATHKANDDTVYKALDVLFKHMPINHEDQMVYLHALEVLTLRNIEDLKQPHFFSGLLQCSQGFIKKEAFMDLKSGKYPPFVDPKVHEMCMKSAEGFYEWFEDNEGDEAGEEYEESEADSQ